MLRPLALEDFAKGFRELLGQLSDPGDLDEQSFRATVAQGTARGPRMRNEEVQGLSPHAGRILTLLLYQDGLILNVSGID